MTAFVAFLRGINVGGKHKIEMAALRQVFADAGFSNIKTILASGNVLFEATEADPARLKSSIEAALQQAFSHQISVLLRSRAEIQTLVDADPFGGIPVTPETRLYITFLPSAPKALPGPAEIPTAENYQILSVTPGEVVSVLTLMPQFGTVDSMEILEKVFGKQVTTRNWNTIQKINSGWL
jgi:uncharacterized protein (DUF1697 family)